ncbi:epoxyqueuosine reductase QueH [Desulfurobacterium atlanticum]|uniref:Epoxyqueuosine reductase QueH n=1 Tax=Desulfurobacterium atlanticum TaxID=240169 RepID=A0A239A5V5_9BACT|nr:epoxyqueuosine reductase QueH [Desulfurobacterium atlanticum]SNR90468.1 hypothetical protein SAMN06265340_11518 [Desulfurobacterium atlanticum]
MKRLLLHICCAPCACYPIRLLKDEGFEITGLFFNPNIHPYQEYLKRMETVRQLEDKEKIKAIYLDRYNLEEWFRMVAFREIKPIRCYLCYQTRLETAASVAKKGKFDFFTSTLLFSKFQYHDKLKEIGEFAGRKFNIPFLYKDFREGWKKGIEISKELNLYRQQYCGCIYSEKERFCKKLKESKLV